MEPIGVWVLLHRRIEGRSLIPYLYKRVTIRLSTFASLCHQNHFLNSALNTKPAVGQGVRSWPTFTPGPFIERGNSPVMEPCPPPGSSSRAEASGGWLLRAPPKLLFEDPPHVEGMPGLQFTVLPETPHRVGSEGPGPQPHLRQPRGLSPRQSPWEMNQSPLPPINPHTQSPAQSLSLGKEAKLT